MKTIEELLDDVIRTELENIKTNVGTPEEQKTRVENLGKLNGIQIDRQELRHKAKTAKRDVAFKAVEITVEVFAIVIPLAFYSGWFHEGMEFEKEGSFTSQAFKGWFGKINPCR